jgi:hypothetical protein
MKSESLLLTPLAEAAEFQQSILMFDLASDLSKSVTLSAMGYLPQQMAGLRYFPQPMITIAESTSEKFDADTPAGRLFHDRSQPCVHEILSPQRLTQLPD